MAIKKQTVDILNLAKEIQKNTGEPVPVPEIARILGLTVPQVNGTLTSFIRHTEGEGDLKHPEPIAERLQGEVEVKENGQVFHKRMSLIKLTDFGLQYSMEATKPKKQ